MKKMKSISSKDIQIAYLIDAVPGVENLVGHLENPAYRLRKILKNLKERKQDTKAFEAYLFKNNFHERARGRKKPASGQDRQYKVQQIKTGEPFLRLPVGALGVGKGDVVRVSFEPGQIVVKMN